MTKAGQATTHFDGSVPPESVKMSNDNGHAAKKAAAIVKPKRVGDPIAGALKRLHDAVADEPIPDSFMDLVAQIEAKIENGRA